ncbi:MAG TPA: efflux RND transporter periplasmic adaptor subunit [Acetobacteraceae bacterium]
MPLFAVWVPQMIGPPRGGCRLPAWLAGVAVFPLALALAGSLTIRHPVAQEHAPAAPPTAVPVSAATVERRDMPVYLAGLGTVQSNNSVQVRARVDGALMSVPVEEGQEVKAGAVVAVIDPRPYQAALDQAAAKRQQDQAQLDNARRDLARTSALVRQDFASRQQFDQNTAAVAQMTAAVAGDAAAVEAARVNLSFCAITAPFDARVGLRQIDPGNLIHAADATPIMTLTQIHPVAVVFTLPQADLPRLAAAMRARQLAVTALPAEGDAALDQGTLVTIDNAVDPATGTIKLKAVFPNAANQLWPGQFVRARLLLDTARGAVTMPSAAVQHGPAGLFAWVVRPDGTAVREAVTLVSDDGQSAILAHGPPVGTVVVVSGQSRLDDGAHVAVAREKAAA